MRAARGLKLESMLKCIAVGVALAVGLGLAGCNGGAEREGERAGNRVKDDVRGTRDFLYDRGITIDTRTAPDGPALAAGEERTLLLTGRCGLPSEARALSVNLAVTQPAAAGNLRLYPAGAPLPLVSSINYSAGQTRGNNGIVSLSPGGELKVKCTQASGTVHFILDVNGYFR